MNEKYYAGVYWLARGESADACAERAGRFFQLLAECDQSLGSWYEKGWTLKQALQRRVGTTPKELLQRFRKIEKRAPGRGFSLALWNGQAAEGGSSLSLQCGAAEALQASYCVFDPPAEGPTAGRMLQAPVFARVLRAMVVAWEPEWGVATSEDHRINFAKSQRAGNFPGWMMYFSRRRGEVPPLPAPVQVEPVEDKGVLVVLTPERFTAANPAHVQLAGEVGEVLSRAGLFGNLQPWV